MTHPKIVEFEKSQMTDNAVDVQVGDTVVVHKVIVEGKKKRIQRFQGTVIKLQGTLSRKSFTVRKIIEGVGVEKSFLLHSPLVPEIKIIKRAKVRRAKLYYLRDRVGARANRLAVRKTVEQTEPKNVSAKPVESKSTEAPTKEAQSSHQESEKAHDKEQAKVDSPEPPALS